MNCLTTAEFVVAKVALAGWLVKDPAHRALADLGLVAPPDLVGRDVRTVGFLRSLDLDPVEVLGACVVATADARRDADATAGAQRVGADQRSSARPIGSQSLMTAQ